jgi:hypothetical protein
VAEESSLDGEEATSAEAQAHEDAVAAAEATGVETRGFRDLLSNHEFRLIWGSQIASQLADKFLVYSLLTVTYDRSGANTQEAIVLLAYTFPSVLLSPIAGIYADRFDKRRLMMVTNLIRGALILLVPGLALVPYFQTVTWHLLIITLLFSAVGQFFAPAEASSLPFIVPKRLLITATSVFTLTIVATLVVGLPVSSLLDEDPAQRQADGRSARGHQSLPADLRRGRRDRGVPPGAAQAPDLFLGAGPRGDADLHDLHAGPGVPEDRPLP